MGARRAFVVATVVLSCSAGAGGNCPTTKCPTATAKMAPLYATPVRFELANVEHSTTTVGVDGECVLTTTLASVGSFDPPPIASFDAMPVPFRLACTDENGTISISAAIDSRNFPLGESTLTGAEAGLVGHAAFVDSSTAAGRQSCVFAVDDLVLHVSVAEATGGRAPFPGAVTPDFHRSLQVSIDTRQGTRTNATHDAGTIDGCASSFYVAASLRFEQTAADYVPRPDAPCACPG